MVSALKLRNALDREYSLTPNMSQIFTIAVDPGYMFDFLAIYEVKMRKATSQDTVDNFTNALAHISNQITDHRSIEILNSPEYKTLRDINAKIYDFVNLAKKDEVKASEVDSANYERYLAKKALQAKFFPDQTVAEKKIGY